MADKLNDHMTETHSLFQSQAADTKHLAESLEKFKANNAKGLSDADKKELDSLIQSAKQTAQRAEATAKSAPKDASQFSQPSASGASGARDISTMSPQERFSPQAGSAQPASPYSPEKTWTAVVPGGAPGSGVPVMGDPLWRAPSADMHTTVQHLAPAGAPSYPATEVQAPTGGVPQTPLPARVVPAGGPTPEEQARMDKEQKQVQAAQQAQKQDPNLNKGAQGPPTGNQPSSKPADQK